MVEAFARDSYPFASADTYLEVLAQNVETTPERTPLYRLRPLARGFEADGLTYGQLAHRAAAFAAFFREHGVDGGDRVVMSMADPHQLLSALVGLWTIGAAGVPLQTSNEFRTAELFRERIARVAEDCRPRLILVDDLARWQASMQGEKTAAPALEAHVYAGSSRRLAFERLPPHTPAIIQYTSGSTGQPKGVVITHENVTANVRAIGFATHVGPSDRVVSWLPLHHDMGLVPLLFGVYWKLVYHVMSPMAFLLRPIVWLRAIQEMRATQSVAPTFAYSLCWRKIPDSQLAGLDLSTWRVAHCGAEPVDPTVTRGFIERFGPYGFRPETFFPVYGLAEATLMATAPSPEDPPVFDTVDRTALGLGVAKPVAESSPHATTFVAVGSAVVDHVVEIRDRSTGERCPERRTGEIVVRGPAISPRYYHDDAQERRPELCTGDLGYVAGGQLYVIDRLKDLVIIRGQNFAPADLEPCAAQVAGLRPGRVAAFSLVGAEGSEELHFAAELDPRSWRSQAAIVADLERRLLSVFGLELAGVALVSPGTLPRTSSGKLRRRACRDLYASGRLPPRLSRWSRFVLRWRFVVQMFRLTMAQQGGAGG